MEVGGVTIADTLPLGSDVLVLNGAGIRTKFGFKVYIGALYLKAKTSDSQAIINGDEPMAITMTWKRSGPVDKVVGVYSDGFKYGAGENYDALKEKIDLFLSKVVKAKKKDFWKYEYQPGVGTSLYNNGELVETIEGLDFKKALFAIWLFEGDTFTGDKRLRKGMLGKK